MVVKTSEDAFVQELENAVRAALKDPRLEPAEVIKAVEAGTKLLAVKHKMTENTEENFFNRKKA